MQRSSKPLRAVQVPCKGFLKGWQLPSIDSPHGAALPANLHAHDTHMCHCVATMEREERRGAFLSEFDNQMRSIRSKHTFPHDFTFFPRVARGAEDDSPSTQHCKSANFKLRCAMSNTRVQVCLSISRLDRAFQ